MYSGINTQRQAFEGNTMKELARAMYDNRARQVQVINPQGESVGNFSSMGVVLFNEMIRSEEERQHIQDQEDWQEHVNQIQRNRD